MRSYSTFKGKFMKIDRSVHVIELVLITVTIEYSHMVTANTKMFYEFAHNYTKFSGLFAGLVEQL